MNNVHIKKNFDLNDAYLTEPIQNLTTEQKEKAAIGELIRASKVDRSKIIEKPEACLSVVQGDKEAILATLGNFSLVIGKAKSKKTFSLVMFFHAIVANQTTRNKFKGNLPHGKTRAIFFDTEQGEYHVQQFDKRVCILLGKADPPNFETYHLRKFTPEERLQIINQVIETTPELGFVAIDGIRDLVNSINDEEEATKIASHLLKWTEEHKIHIMTVLHQNKGDNNARGHVGTELVNKAETVLSVTRDEQDTELSIVSVEYCREMAPEPFAFRINENGLPEICADWTPAKGINKVTVPHEISDIVHQLKLAEIFRNEEERRGTDFIESIRNSYGVGESKAKQFRSYFKDKGWVKWNSKTGSANDPKGFYTLNFENAKRAKLDLFDKGGV